MNDQLTQGPKGYFTSVTFESESGHLPNQTHRSSENFNLTELNPNYEWEFVIPSGIVLSIKEDKKGPDPVIQQNITNGTKASSALHKKEQIYVSDPKGAKTKFSITLKIIEEK